MEGIHHVALRVRDCVASARFYEQTFGLREIRRLEEGDHVQAVWLGVGDAVLMLERSIRGAGLPEGSGHVLIFLSGDLVAAETKMNDLGVRVTDRTASTLYVLDPDGHRAGVSVYPFVSEVRS